MIDRHTINHFSGKLHNISHFSGKLHNISHFRGKLHTISHFSGKLHTISHFSGKLHTISHFSGKLHTISHFSGKLHTISHFSGKLHTISHFSGKLHTISHQKSYSLRLVYLCKCIIFSELLNYYMVKLVSGIFILHVGIDPNFKSTVWRRLCDVCVYYTVTEPESQDWLNVYGM